MKNLIFSFAFLLALTTLSSQTISTVPVAKQYTFSSEIMGEDYYLQISLPLFLNPNKKYPVLFYLDAYTNSGGINEMVKVQMFNRIIDPVIAVGISYNINPMELSQKRWRDYVPTTLTGDPNNKGEDFIQFIKSELIPYMESNYNTDPAERGLLGFSLGGLITAYSLVDEPGLFNKLAIISPSLQIGNGKLLNDPVLLENINKMTDLEVFLCYGSLESENFSDLGRYFMAKLDSNKSINTKLVMFEGETHGSIWYSATARAILTLYQNQYEALKQEVYSYYQKKEYDKALSSFEKIFESFPQQSNEEDRFNMACISALAGETDNAFKWLNTLTGNTEENWYEAVTTDDDLSSLHNHEKWNELINNLKQ